MVIFCAMMAKLAITASYGAVYVYTAEQFPTVVRNMGLGVGSFFARIGGIVAPYINNTVRRCIKVQLESTARRLRVAYYNTIQVTNFLLIFRLKCGSICRWLCMAVLHCWSECGRLCCPRR